MFLSSFQKEHLHGLDVRARVDSTSAALHSVLYSHCLAPLHALYCGANEWALHLRWACSYVELYGMTWIAQDSIVRHSKASELVKLSIFSTSYLCRAAPFQMEKLQIGLYLIIFSCKISVKEYNCVCCWVMYRGCELLKTYSYIVNKKHHRNEKKILYRWRWTLLPDSL